MNLRATMETLSRIVDCMRGCDPEYVAAHSGKQTTDDEWDDTLAEAEELLESLEAEEHAGL
jgi:hypothetical protein